MKDRIRVRITQQFEPKPGEPGHGFRYVKDAIVGVSLGVAREWIAAGRAAPYDDAAKAALGAAESTPAPIPPPAT